MEALDANLQSANRIISELRTAKSDAWHKCDQLKAESSRLRSAMKAMRLRMSLGWFSVLGVLTIYLVFVYSSKSTLAMELAKARAEATAATLRMAEWCEDWYQNSMNTPEILRLYPDLAADGAGQKYRVLRGGSWADDNHNYLLSAFRYGSLPGDRDVNVGFRVVLTEGTAN